MPFKTARSPLKRGGSLRFQPSLLAYSDSPMQVRIGFALAIDDTSDRDNNDSDDSDAPPPSDESASESEREQTERRSPVPQPLRGSRRSASAPDVTLNRSTGDHITDDNDDDDNNNSDDDHHDADASSNAHAPPRLSWTRNLAGTARVSIASTLTGARQALHARERSVAASFQRLRCSSSDRQSSVTQDAKTSHDTKCASVLESRNTCVCSIDNQEEQQQPHKQNDEANQSLDTSNTSNQQHRELNEVETAPTESKSYKSEAPLAQPRPVRPTRAKALRTRTKSYQSALSKYFPTIFDHRTTAIAQSQSPAPPEHDRGHDSNASAIPSSVIECINVESSASIESFSSARAIQSQQANKTTEPTHDEGMSSTSASRPKRFALWPSRKRSSERDHSIGRTSPT